MECLAYDSGRCRSCTLIETPYVRQVESKQATLERLLGESLPDGDASIAWQEPVVGPESGFRTKAKMVVAGSADAPTIGILDAQGRGVDLRDCPLYDSRLTVAFPALAAFVSVAGVEPYAVPERRGELKHIVVTVSPSGGLMARFVLRSTEALSRIRKHLPWLQEQLPALTVVTVNVLPEHRAVIEGEREIVLTSLDELPMDLGDVTLRLRPQSFFQTNTDVAGALYSLVSAWVHESRPSDVWDLYCGVGGFALHCLADGRTVTGVESSPQAVESAQSSARALAESGVPGAQRAHFVAADATQWALAQGDSASARVPDVVIVNPPRRGIGAELARWLEHSGVPRVVYSSCNADTLARDLRAMPSLVPVRARLLDMFPQTEHFEAAVLLERR